MNPPNLKSNKIMWETLLVQCKNRSNRKLMPVVQHAKTNDTRRKQAHC